MHVSGHWSCFSRLCGQQLLRWAVAIPLTLVLVVWLPQQLNQRGPVQFTSEQTRAPMVLPPPTPPKAVPPQLKTQQQRQPQRLPAPAPVPSTNNQAVMVPLVAPSLAMPALTAAPLPQLSRGLASLADVDQPPKLLKYLPPKTPLRAKNAGLNGKVVLRLVVDEQGMVVEAKVQQANPEGYFEQAALDAAKRWRFKPALIAEQAVTVFVDVPINFELN